jgi:hypothetical protein
MGIVYFEGSNHFIAFEIIQNNMQRCNSTYRRGLQNVHEKKNGLYGGSVKIISVNEIYKVYASIYFVFEARITEPLTTVAGQARKKLKKWKG